MSQQSNLQTLEQIIVLKNGFLLKGKVEVVDAKTIKVLTENRVFSINKRDIAHRIPGNIFTNPVESPSESLVILRNKKWIKAQLLEISSNKIVMKNNGVASTFPASKVLKIYASNQSEILIDQEDVYTSFDEFGIELQEVEDQDQDNRKYNITNVGYILLQNFENLKIEDLDITDGFSVQHTIGYKMNQYFGVGLHLGFTYYQTVEGMVEMSDCFPFCPSNVNAESSAISSGISIRGDFAQKKIRPYYNVDFGFSRTLRGESLNFQIAQFERNSGMQFDKTASRPKLGYMFHPAIGMEFKLMSMDLLCDFGYQIANLKFNTGFFKRDEDIFYSQRARTTLGRFVFRVGISL